MGSYVGPVARAHCYLKHLGTAFLSIAETVVTFLIVNYCFATLLLHSVDCFKLIFFPFDLRPPGHHIYNYFLLIYKTSYTYVMSSTNCSKWLFLRKKQKSHSKLLKLFYRKGIIKRNFINSLRIHYFMFAINNQLFFITLKWQVALFLNRA